MTDERAVPADGQTAERFDADGAPTPASPGASPIGAGLMARLFGVPLIIVGIVVAAAVLVVMLFGSIGAEKQRPVAALLSTLEQGGGAKSLGVLLPRDKELWQVAQELALRLQHKERELTPEELEQVVVRLIALLQREAAVSTEGADAAARQLHEQRVAYLAQALSLTGDGRTVEPIAALLDASSPLLRRDAIRALAQMKDVPAARAEALLVSKHLADPDPVVRVVAAVALSSLATPGDLEIVAALTRALDDEREVSWNAALSLARLGGPAAKGVLTDMLDRDYWQNTVKLQGPDGTPSYPMPPHLIDEYLKVAIDAAVGLNNADLWSQIRGLQSDPSLLVSQHAKAAVGRAVVGK